MSTQNQTATPLANPPDEDVDFVPTGIETDFLPEDEGAVLSDAELREMLGFAEVPILLIESSPDLALQRQKEMMETVFDGIGEEKKEEKQVGLAMQQLDIEQRHALRLLLIYEDPVELARHLKRCLDDPVYGYGERGNQGRTIAQAMAAVGDIDEMSTLWLTIHREFQDLVLNQGWPFSFRSMFDFADITSFVPLVKRTGPDTWILGIENEGKHKVFTGSIETVWDSLCDTFVEWSDQDNHDWLSDIKDRATRLPDSIIRVAQAERLRKETCSVQVDGTEIVLKTQKDSAPAWPRGIVLGDQIGLNRLSGHAFYEVAWEGGLHVRRFELSDTSKNRVPIEHIEIAMRMAEILGAEHNLSPDPVTANDVEATFLRRLKVKRAGMVRPRSDLGLPPLIKGTPVAAYKARGITAIMLHSSNGSQDLAYIAYEDGDSGKLSDEGVLLQRNPSKGLIEAFPVNQGRPLRGGKLMDTPLAEIDLKNGAWLRSVCAWGAWLTRVTTVQRQ